MEYRTEGIEIPIGVIYLLCDPRQAEFDADVIEHSKEFEEIVWKQIIERCPQAEILGGVKIVPYYLFKFDFAMLSNPSQAYDYFDMPEVPSFPTFIYRCPHAHNICVSHTDMRDALDFDEEKKYFVGSTQCFYLGYKTFKNIAKITENASDVALVLGDQIADNFLNMSGITKQDCFCYAENKHISVVDAKTSLNKMMWEGEMDLLSLEDKHPFSSDFFTLLNEFLSSPEAPDGFLSLYFKWEEYYKKHMSSPVTMTGDVPRVFRNFIKSNQRLFEAFPKFKKTFEEKKDNNNECFIKKYLNGNNVMNEQKARDILSGLLDLYSIQIQSFGYKDFFCLLSRENTNDLLHWFEANANRLEENLENLGYNWCYVIEKAIDSKGNEQHPFIYVFFGKDISQSMIKELCPGINRDLDKYTFHEDSLSVIDLKQYYTALEKAIVNSGATCIREFETCNEEDIEIVSRKVRHLNEEEKENSSNSKVGRKKISVLDYITSENKEDVLAKMKAEMPKLPNGPSQAGYLNKLKVDGVLSNFPSFNALKEEELITVSKTAWNNAIKVYR